MVRHSPTPKTGHIVPATGVYTAPIGTILPITITPIMVCLTGNMDFPSISAGDDPGEAGVITPTTTLTIGVDIMITGDTTVIPSTLRITAVTGEDGMVTTTGLL